MSSRFLQLTALAAVLVAASACGGGDDDEKTATAPAGTPAPTVSAGPPGEVDGNTYTSVARNYRITFPEGWSPDENFIVTELFIVDAFLGPVDGTPPDPSITVTCNAPQGMTPEQFIENKRLFASNFAVNEIVDEQPATLDGEPAVQLAYTQVAGTVTLHKVEVHQMRGECGWTLTLTSDPADDFMPEFQASVASFEIVD